MKEQAFKWWYKLTLEQKFYKTIAWLKSKDRNVTDIHPHNLTDIQILEIYSNNK